MPPEVEFRFQGNDILIDRNSPRLNRGIGIDANHDHRLFSTLILASHEAVSPREQCEAPEIGRQPDEPPINPTIHPMLPIPSRFPRIGSKGRKSAWFLFRRLHVVAAISSILVVAGCHTIRHAQTDGNGTAWIGTWSTAVQLVEPRNLPPEPGLSFNTLRQVVRVSVGGERVRVRFSNEFGHDPVTLGAARIAVSAGGSAIDTGSDRELTFGGEATVVIPPGALAVSDPVVFSLRPGTEVTLTIHFGETAPDVTGHPGSRTTSYLHPGNAVSAADLPGAAATDRWYIIAGIDVDAPARARAIVALGDSITDGRGSGTNRQNRWPDELARRLQAGAGTRDTSVLNKGIGGNCVLRNCLGPAAMARFDRDVLDEAGVAWLIVLHGINDIGGASPGEAPRVARDLVSAYEQMIERAHARGIRVYGATLLPFGGSFYDTPEREAAREAVNAWIRTSARFDGVIDLDAALRDPQNPSRLLPAADTGDHLHPNELGHRMIAEAIDLSLFF